jgi:cytochrome c oxidase subunit 1
MSSFNFQNPSPAKLFWIACAIVWVVTILSALYRIIGTTALDLFRHDSGIFNVSHLVGLNPLLFALLATIYAMYAKICRRRLVPVLVSVHFWTTLAFALLVVYLSRDRLDIPVPDWREQSGTRYEIQATVFLAARIVFGLAQMVFLFNLAWSYFLGRELPTSTA